MWEMHKVHKDTGEKILTAAMKTSKMLNHMTTDTGNVVDMAEQYEDGYTEADFISSAFLGM